MNLQEAYRKVSRLVDNMEKVIVGKKHQILLTLAALFARGHVLLEDVPGVGKTVLAKALALSIQGEFKRIQCTPDLLPADVTGVNIFHPQKLSFQFRPGPVFTNILLCDEINRATPRTQSSLLECMEEGQVTLDGVTHRLKDPFFVIATQNPIEQQGTFPLPEAQLDRFLLCLELGYPSHEEECEILSRQEHHHPLEDIQPVISCEELLKIQKLTPSIYLHRDIQDYIVTLVRTTRHHPDILLGASPRASLALMKASRALALLKGQDFVTPQMVKDLAVPVLAHRILLKPQLKVQEISAKNIIEGILKKVPPPVVNLS